MYFKKKMVPIAHILGSTAAIGGLKKAGEFAE